MANWCSNTVVFEGKPETITAIQELFQSMKEKEEKIEEGQFQYETKWSPNMEIIQKIAEHYEVNFTHDYEEMGNLVYGRATFYDKLLTDVYLEDVDFEQYEFDEENETYHFEGNDYESDYEILENLLERKIKIQET